MTGDLARLLFTPSAAVNGEPRAAEVLLVREEPFDVESLAATSPSAAAPECARSAPPPASPGPVLPASAFAKATRRWKAAHPGDWPAKPGKCPACGHHDCFHALPGDADSWFCFSASHAADAPGVGRPSGAGHVGDSLDLEAYRRGVEPAQVLRADGYLGDLRREGACGTSKGTAAGPGSSSRDDEPPPPPIVTVLAEVKVEPVEWLWPDRIPFGKQTLCDGDPGLGKSTMALDIAARVSTGRQMPDGTGGGVPGGILVASAEDDLASTVRPRLEAAGADLARVVEVRLRTSVDDTDGHLPVVPYDLREVEAVVQERGIRLVIFDPLMALLDGEVNSFRDQDVRRALAPVAAMAQRTRAAVFTVRHLNKSTGGQAIYRGGGSIGIAGAARSVLLVAKDPDDPERRVLASVKCNLAAIPQSLAFRLVPVTGRPREFLGVEWLGPSPHSADALLAAAAVPAEDAGPIDEAEEFLLDVLRAGPVPSKEVLSQARSIGISAPTLRRAKARLRVRSMRYGTFGSPGPWRWALPAVDDREPPYMITSGGRSPTGGSDHLRGVGSGGLTPEEAEGAGPPAFPSPVGEPCPACESPGSGRLHYGCASKGRP